MRAAAGETSGDTWAAWLGRAIAELASRQHGVVSRMQLLDLGLTSSGVTRMLRSGRLHRLHPGVYAVGHRVLAPRGWWMAAVLSGGPGALLSHRSAAALRGLVDGMPSTVDVLVLRTGTRSPGVRPHRVRDIRPQDRSTVDGIPCTSLARTLLDLATVGTERTLDRALRKSLAAESYDDHAFREVLARRRKGTTALRLALAHIEGDAEAGVVTKSELELRFLELLRRHDFVRPATNVSLPTPRRTWEVDALWSAQRLVVELDGWWVHADRESFRRDRRRGIDVRLAGYEVIRLDWAIVVASERDTVLLLDGLIPRIGSR